MSTRLEETEKEQLTREEAAGIFLLFARLFREAPAEEHLNAFAQSGEEIQADQIAIEFASLFLVPGDKLISPYESYYCDTLSVDHSTACSPYFQSEPSPVGLKGYLGGSSASAVRRVYQKAGFEMDSGFHDLADHISVELEFLGRLIQAGCFDDAGQFFKEHLGRWVFRLLEDLRKCPDAKFYSRVADAVDEFLKSCGMFSPSS